MPSEAAPGLIQVWALVARQCWTSQTRVPPNHVPSTTRGTTPTPWSKNCSWRRQRWFPVELCQGPLDFPSDAKIRVGLQGGDPIGYLGIAHLAEHSDHRLAHLRGGIVQC